MEALALHYETKAMTPVGIFFEKARMLEIGQEYVNLYNNSTRQWYGKNLHKLYDIIFDRVMTSDISPFQKSEMESWYFFSREKIGLLETKNLNNELEEMLTRFELL